MTPDATGKQPLRPWQADPRCGVWRGFRPSRCAGDTHTTDRRPSPHRRFPHKWLHTLPSIPLRLSIIPRRNRIQIVPKADLPHPGLPLGVGILHTVRRRLLSLILLVVPRHARPDLLQVDVFAVQGDFVQEALIFIIIADRFYAIVITSYCGSRCTQRSRCFESPVRK
jgi:hypothetical protein